jgi:hypothetical protein
MSLKKDTALDFYARKGWFNRGKYSAMERVWAGKMLSADFHLAGLTFSGVAGYKERVDCQGSRESDGLLDAKDRYNKAIKSIPAEFLPIVRLVCCEDKKVPILSKKRIDADEEKTEAKQLLRLGLDRLVDYYIGLGK